MKRATFHGIFRFGFVKASNKTNNSENDSEVINPFGVPTGPHQYVFIRQRQGDPIWPRIGYC